MPKKLELSRRRLLGGLGTIGLASAGAGLGTSAYFNDTESFTDNTVQAGTLDLSVHASGFADQDGIGPDQGDFYSMPSEGGDGGTVGMGFEITDLKPGDTYDLCWCISNTGNPAVVRAYIPWDSVTYASNTSTAAAADLPGIDSVDDFMNPLESEHITLSQNMYPCGPEGVDKTRPFLKEDVQYDSDGPAGPAGWEWDGGLGSWVSSLGDHENSRHDGVPIGSHNGVGDKNPEPGDQPLSEGRSDYVLIGGTDDAHWSAVAYCVTINVSTDAGNELQGGSASFNLEFRAEQARHNEHPFHPELATRPRTDSPTDWTNIPV